MHSMSTTPANVNDAPEANRLQRGEELRMWGDARYQGFHQREENRGFGVDWQVVMKPGWRQRLEPGSAEALTEKLKASLIVGFSNSPITRSELVARAADFSS